MYLACWPQSLNDANHYGGLFITDDGGATWRLAFDASPHVYGVALDPDNPSTLFINTFNGGAYRSDDRGATWQRLGGYNFKWGHRPVPDPINKGMLYLTTFGSSVWHGPATGVPGAFEDVFPINGLTVALVNPTSGSVFSSGKPVQLIAKAAADTAGMKQVEFFGNGISLGMAEAIPTPPGSRTAALQTQGAYFVLVWSNPPAGTYNLTARLTNSAGAVAVSSNVTIVVQ